MHDLTAAEVRVLGCLVEKQRTTPDQYPLTLNALRLACNQATNRDPVLDLGESAVREAAQRLSARRYARLASGHTTRAVKYRHLLDEALGVAPDELAVLAVLMLRGPQTPGELKGRTERLHAFADLAAVEDALARLGERALVLRLPRRPGQKEDRFRHLLEGEAEDAGAESPVAAPAPVAEAPDPLGPRVERLERELAEVRAQVAALREELGAD